jgi:DinB superfamily
MDFDLAAAVALLERTPRTVRAMLGELEPAWTDATEGPDTWSPRVVVGHLIHGERTDWIPRAKIILQSGDAQPFPKFDRWAQMRESEGKTLSQLLDEFARARSENLSALRSLDIDSEKLALRGSHPALGSVTMSQLLSTWTAHDMTHLHQISRIMAHQHREAVGPWIAYLGVLQCAGHSA